MHLHTLQNVYLTLEHLFRDGIPADGLVVAVAAGNATTGSNEVRHPILTDGMHNLGCNANIRR
jgi:hypothetical protein